MSNDAPRSAATAEMIYEKPLSGAFTEISFGSDRGNTLWVKFSDGDGVDEWIGKFGCGYRQVMRVTKAVEPDTFMIIAGGFAYLINATTRLLLNHYYDTFAEDIVYDASTHQFIAADTHLRIIEDGREIWVSRRIALDDVNDLSINRRIVTGTAYMGYENETAPFSLNLDTRELTATMVFSDHPAVVLAKKPWWKVWA